MLGFRWSKKATITLETISFWQNISIIIFKLWMFSIFIYNESLPIKSYQFFKICKRFDKEKEKTLTQQSMRKETLKKFGLCFIAVSFINSFNMMIIFVSQAHSQPNFRFLISGWCKKYKKGSRELQITRNGKLQYLFQR